jgi:hypothetical protein
MKPAEAFKALVNSFRSPGNRGVKKLGRTLKLALTKPVLLNRYLILVICCQKNFPTLAKPVNAFLSFVFAAFCFDGIPSVLANS